jgi:hypothetical protein
MNTLLHRIRQCFVCIPKDDSRAQIGPRDFVTSLILGFAQSTKKRTIESLRKSLMAMTGKKLSRGSFWERLATRRLLGFLTLTAETLIIGLAESTCGSAGMTGLLKHLKVMGILILDSTSISLPENAGIFFPGPRSNVAPSSIKWHNCFDLCGGLVKWFELGPAREHDSNYFPDLSLLVGKLIIFDLGYWNYELLAAIKNAGGYFLSRIKDKATIEIIEVVKGLEKRFVGWPLLDMRLPEKKKIIEVIGEFQKNSKAVFQARVIGFWNPTDNIYHWYVTNLKVSAHLIYPLYRLRWQVELLFKKAKSSLNLSDITSTNPNIIQSFIMLTIIATLLAHPIAKVVLKGESISKTPSIQRAGMVLVHIGTELRNFIILRSKASVRALIDKLELFSDELYDPNFSKRDSSMARVLKLSTQLL